MGAKSLLFAGLVTAAAVLASLPVQASAPIYITVTGQNQGVFKGDVTAAGYQGAMEATAVTVGLASASGPNNGAGARAAKDEPLVFRKLLDGTSPLFLEAFATHEVLKSVVIQFVSVGSGGALKTGTTITLTSATVVSFEQDYGEPDFSSDSVSSDLVTLKYQSMSVTSSGSPATGAASSGSPGTATTGSKSVIRRRSSGLIVKPK